jgi:hypothetical protein
MSHDGLSPSRAYLQSFDERFRDPRTFYTDEQAEPKIKILNLLSTGGALLNMEDFIVDAADNQSPISIRPIFWYIIARPHYCSKKLFEKTELILQAGSLNTKQLTEGVRWACSQQNYSVFIQISFYLSEEIVRAEIGPRLLKAIKVYDDSAINFILGCPQLVLDQTYIMLDGEEPTYPICEAVSVRNRMAVQKLLECGASSKVRDANGESPYEVAVQNGYTFMIEMFKKYEEDDSGALVL